MTVPVWLLIAVTLACSLLAFLFGRLYGRSMQAEFERETRKDFVHALWQTLPTDTRLREFLRRAVDEFIAPMGVSHIPHGTKWRVDADKFISECRTFLAGPEQPSQIKGGEDGGRKA